MPRQLIGTVASDKMDKTISVLVTRQKTHSLYRKAYQTGKKYLAHDPDSTARVGDLVVLKEIKPISRRKRWQVEKVLQKAEDAEMTNDKPKPGEEEKR